MTTMLKSETITVDQEKLERMLEPDVKNAGVLLAEAEQEQETTKHELMKDVPKEQQPEIFALAEKIDISQPEMIMQYGNQSQRGLSSFSDSVLSEVKLKDGGDAGVLLSELMGKVRKMDVKTLEQKDSFLARLPLVGGYFSKAEARMMQWEDMESFLENVVKNLDVAKYGLLKDITKLDQMYEKNTEYFKELNLYIKAGELKILQFEEEVLAPLRLEAKENPDPLISQNLNDLTHNKDRFEKRIHDLKLSRTMSQQMAPQIRVVQQNNQILAEKIQSSVVNTIPLWKNQVVMALSLSRQQNALKAQQDVTETTNALLEQNSAMLKISSIEIAKENEKGIVSIESLKIAQQNLLETLDETLEIQSEGKIRRKEAEQQLLVMEQEMADKILKIAEKEKNANA